MVLDLPFKNYIRLLRLSWLLLLITALACAAVGGLYCLVKQPEWQATAKVYLYISGASSVTDLNQGGAYTQQIVKSFVDITTTPVVLDPVVRQTGGYSDATRLSEHMQVDALLDTSIITISVTDASSSRAADLANAVVASLKNAVPRLSSSSGSGPDITLSTIQRALPPSSPDSPRPALVVPTAFGVGLLLGMLIVFLRGYFDRRIRSRADLESLLEEPALAALPTSAIARSNSLVIRAEPRDSLAEGYRVLRTKLRYFTSSSSQGTVFCVTSSAAGEGKSTTVANLAIAIADAGSTVCVIDADLRRPRIAATFSLDGSLGLSDVLIGGSTLDHSLQYWADQKVAVLPSGPVPPNPSELLQHKAMEELLMDLRSRFDYILIDSPPVLAVADPLVVGAYADHTIVLCAALRTTTDQLLVTMNTLRGVGIHIAGAVLNMVVTRDQDGYGYSYSYGYAQDDTSEDLLRVKRQ